MNQDDPRFEEWPSRKPTAQQRKIEKFKADPVGVTRGAVEKAVERSVSRTVSRHAPKISAKVGAGIAAAAPLAAKGGLLAAAGFASYWLTSKLRSVRWATYDDLLYDISNRYRHARQAAEAEYGRKLTPEESAQFKRFYDMRVAEVREAQARGQRPMTFRFGD